MYLFIFYIKEILPGLFLGPYSAAMKSKVIITVTRTIVCDTWNDTRLIPQSRRMLGSDWLEHVCFTRKADVTLDPALIQIPGIVMTGMNLYLWDTSQHYR